MWSLGNTWWRQYKETFSKFELIKTLAWINKLINRTELKNRIALYDPTYSFTNCNLFRFIKFKNYFNQIKSLF